jgi:hypothetical protein
MVRIGDMEVQDQAAILPNVYVRVLTQDMGTPGTTAVTGIGFKPSYILLWCCAPGQKAASFGPGFPGTPGTGSRGMCTTDLSTGVDTWSGQGYPIYMDLAGTDFYGYLTSLDSDGFTLKWDSTAGGGNCQITYMAVK